MLNFNYILPFQFFAKRVFQVKYHSVCEEVEEMRQDGQESKYYHDFYEQ